MLITWDEKKRALNSEIHGFDFADFEAGFDFESAVRFPTFPSRTGRTRYALIGWFRGAAVTVAIVSPLGTEALSLISFRPASKEERDAHGF